MVVRRHIMTVLCTVVLLSLAMVSNGELIPYNSATMQYPVTPAQAIQSARDWSGDANLDLVLVGIRVSASESPLPHRYVFKKSDDSEAFGIDCRTGEVFNWENTTAVMEYTRKCNEHMDESTQLPAAQLRSIITQFLQTKYAGFTALNLQPHYPDELATRYVQRLPNGVWYFGNTAACMVDEWSGDILHYFGTHNGLPSVSSVAAISAQQAGQIAVDFTGTLSIFDADAADEDALVHPQSAFVLGDPGLSIGVDDLGVQRLQWRCTVVIHPNPAYTASYYWQESTEPPCIASGEEVDVYIDAQTGEVFDYQPGGCVGASPSMLDKNTALAIKSRKPDPKALKVRSPYPAVTLRADGVISDDPFFPPLLVGDTGYIYVGYAAAMYSGSFSWKSGAVVLTIGGRSCTVRPGSKRLIVNGRSISLRQPARIVNGRMYVPCEAVKQICGATAVWDAKRKEVRIQSGKTPLKASLRRPPSRVDAAD